MVVASCLKGLGYISIFDMNSKSFTIKLSMQSLFDEACTDGLMLSLQPRSTSLKIYAHSPISRFNSVYRANKINFWKSEPAHDESDIVFVKDIPQMVGFALLEINVPNSPGLKVKLNLGTFEAELFQ